MTASLSTKLARAERRIDALCWQQLPTQHLVEGIAEELRAAMPVDAMIVAATDPDTLLALGAGVVQGMPQSMCHPFWEYEFEVPDFNKFTDLARGPRRVADLHAATGGRPERSAGGTRRFSDEEVAFVEAIAPVVGRGLRASLVCHAARSAAGRGPGMVVVDADSRVVSATPGALAWFEELESVYKPPDPLLGIDVPSEITVAAQVARGRAAAGASTAATRTRVRTRSGVWLLIHGSCLRAADGTAAHAAVVIEPAKASEVAPLIVDAYELTPREVDVTRALARGLTTNEIAHELHLSRYTVQDHLKSVYEKTGVSSRGELVAKMFADHYHDALKTAIHGARAAAAA